MLDLTPEQVTHYPQALGSSVIHACERAAREQDDPSFRAALLELAAEIEPFVVYEFKHDVFDGWAFENWWPVVRVEPVQGKPVEEWPASATDALQVTLYLTADRARVEVS
ncbi:hypothetical protein [Pseudonocardia adelaidensis]|uniref:Uncharacterized protein n=1 Tax=Pseudonocardia adelaidensis TaxID=648754 RepID=A0ABP9NLV2_9PSEU